MKNKNSNKVTSHQGNDRGSAPAIRPIVVTIGAAICLSLASCVGSYGDGYGQYSGPSSGYPYYQPGYRITSLPQGYRRETLSGTNYYYHNGAYYQRSSNGYIVTEAPRSSRYYNEYSRVRQTVSPSGRINYSDYEGGYQTTTLPRGYKRERISGQDYYYYNGVYYQRSANGYIATAAPSQSRYYNEYNRLR